MKGRKIQGISNDRNAIFADKWLFGIFTFFTSSFSIQNHGPQLRFQLIRKKIKIRDKQGNTVTISRIIFSFLSTSLFAKRELMKIPLLPLFIKIKNIPG